MPEPIGFPDELGESSRKVDALRVVLPILVTQSAKLGDDIRVLDVDLVCNALEARIEEATERPQKSTT
jgi:hypothetical protein